MALRPSNDQTIPYCGRFTVWVEAFETYAGDWQYSDALVAAD